MRRELLAALTAGVLAGCVAPSGQASPGASSPPAGSDAASASPGGSIGPEQSSSTGLTFRMESFPVPPGSHPHDVAPAVDGGVWYTAQRAGILGWLDPGSGRIEEVFLGQGSAPHGVVVGPDGAPWITDGGLNAIIRVEPATSEVATYPLPAEARNANLNTAAFDGDGVLWFTGNAGWYGRLDPETGSMRVYPAPRGEGPYGIDATPDGEIYFSSLAGSYLGAVDRESGEVTVIDSLTAGAGLRRVWADSQGRLWTAEWFAGAVGVYDPASGAWREWTLPNSDGQPAQAYAVYVDETDAVWLTDFTANALVRFDPVTETFDVFPFESQPAEVRQLLGREGEVWGAESAADRLMVMRWSE